MRIAVISDTRLPTRADGGHGLGMSAHSIATGLAERGHEVTLFAGPGSEYDGDLHVGLSERANARQALDGDYDAILDTSHQHHASRMDGLFPVLNRICDLECRWQPPNVVVNSPFMQGAFGGRLVNTGIDVGAIPFFEEGGEYLAFMAAKFAHKGWPAARRMAWEAGRDLMVIEGLSGSAKWDALGNAYALLHPTRADAADRAPLEAAACGVPVLCLDQDGTQHHVAHAVSGYVCESDAAIVETLNACRVRDIDRRAARAWVEETHGLAQMIDGYETLLVAMEDGERW